jgi:hypothetical protein
MYGQLIMIHFVLYAQPSTWVVSNFYINMKLLLTSRAAHIPKSLIGSLSVHM